MATRLARKNLGMTLLAVWLILSGVMPFLAFGVQGMGPVMNLLAVAAGILILMGR